LGQDDAQEPVELADRIDSGTALGDRSGDGQSGRGTKVKQADW
jgi:hypothetical protein